MCDLLSACDLASMRDTLNTSLPGTAYLLRRTLTPDGQGGNTQAYGTAGTVTCRLSPPGQARAGSEEVHGERQAAMVRRMITLPANTTVLTTDRLLIGAETFEVTTVHAPRSWELSVRIDAVEIS